MLIFSLIHHPRPAPLTTAQLPWHGGLNNPIWDLEPTKKGNLDVAKEEVVLKGSPMKFMILLRRKYSLISFFPPSSLRDGKVLG